MKFRQCLFWAHLCCGVAAGLVVLMMSVTGVLLTYERQMTAWADLASLPDITVGNEHTSMEAILATARNYAPDIAATAVTLNADAQAPLTVSLGRDRVLYFDPYSGILLGEGAPQMRNFLNVTRSVHRWFNVGDDGRETARAITGAANMVFAFIVLSGIYLWLPRVYRWSQFRVRMLFRKGLPDGKARDFNWHHVFSFWACLPLMLIILSGIVFSYSWANELVFRVFGEKPPVRGEFRRPAPGAQSSDTAIGIAGSELDVLIQSVVHQTSEWRTITINLPSAPVETLALVIDRGDGGQPQLQSTLTLDTANGEVRGLETFIDLSPGRRTRTVLRRLHTGEVFGVTGQTVAGLASLAAIMLVWTGLALAYRRLIQPWCTRRRA